MAPAEHPALADVLEATARRCPRRGRRLAAGRHRRRPVRYKPGDRCVIRYRLRFGDRRRLRTPRRGRCTLVAKLYREQREARGRRRRSWPGCTTGVAAGWTARPLGVVPGLPLALTEDLGSSRDAVPTRSGLDVVHPGSEEAVDVVRRAARALAELHTCGLDTGGPEPAHGSRRGREGGQARPAARAVRPRAGRGGAAGRRRAVRHPGGSARRTPCARATGATSRASCWSATAPSSSWTSTSSAWPTQPSTSDTSSPTCGPPGSGTTGPAGASGSRRPPSAFLESYLQRLAERGESGGRPCGHRRPRAGVRGRAAAEDRGPPGQPAAQPPPRRGGRGARRGLPRSLPGAPGRAAPRRAVSPPGSAR